MKFYRVCFLFFLSSTILSPYYNLYDLISIPKWSDFNLTCGNGHPPNYGFQSQNGLILTIRVLMRNSPVDQFQSQNGLILTGISNMIFCTIRLFQSQNGLILTCLSLHLCISIESFQSQNGLILTCAFAVPGEYVNDFNPKMV